MARSAFDVEGGAPELGAVGGGDDRDPAARIADETGISPGSEARLGGGDGELDVADGGFGVFVLEHHADVLGGVRAVFEFDEGVDRRVAELEVVARDGFAV